MTRYDSQDSDQDLFRTYLTIVDEEIDGVTFYALDEKKKKHSTKKKEKIFILLICTILVFILIGLMYRIGGYY